MSVGELPQYHHQTFSFDPADFDNPQFDAGAFLARAQAHASLEQLHTELEAYLAALKKQLYELINRDYADFIQVSTKLSGVETKVADLSQPILALCTQIQALRAALAAELGRLEAVLVQRAAVQSRRRTVKRCLRFLESLESAERLLGIGEALEDPHAHDAPGTAAATAGALPALQPPAAALQLDPDALLLQSGDDGNSCWSDSDDGTDSAAARQHGSANAAPAAPAALQPNERRRRRELCSNLERASHYVLMLNADAATAASTATAGDGSAAAADPALQALTGMSVRASRVEVEAAQRLKSAFSELVAPQSLPVSAVGAAGDGAEAGGNGGAAEEQGGGMDVQALCACLRAFAALGCGWDAEKQFAKVAMQPFLDGILTQGRLDAGARGSCQGLAAIYDSIVHHVTTCCAPAVQACASTFGTSSSDSSGGGAAPPIDLLGNGIWQPVATSLASRVPSIFATGLADTFHRNYTLSEGLARRLAEACGAGARGARHLDAHPASTDFRSRWNLPVYFQLRQREVTAALDDALTASAGAAAPPDTSCGADGPRLCLAGTAAAWLALRRIWAADVFLLPTAHRGLRLTLQVLSRYLGWAEEALSVPDATPEGAAAVAADLAALAKACGAGGGSGSSSCPLAATIAQRLTSPEAAAVAAEAAAAAVAPWAGVAADAWSRAVDAVVARCVALLQAVRGVAATYRMTNRPPPERASAFVRGILRPLRDFDADWGDRAPSPPPSKAAAAPSQQWRTAALERVTEAYLTAVRELLQTARQMEEALRKRRGARRAAAAGGLSDTDKIVLQLQLDAQEYARELAAMGVDAAASPAYQAMLAAASDGSRGGGGSLGDGVSLLGGLNDA